MALGRRQVNMDNVENRKVVGQNKMQIATGPARNALGSIGNFGATKLDIQRKKAVPLKTQVTRSNSTLQKDICKPTEKQLAGPTEPPQQVVDKEISEELNRSLMEISLCEEAQGFSSNLLPAGITDIDSQDKDNQFLCSDYIMDIYKYLRSLESQWSIRPDFLNKQKDITPRMRGILIDWLNQVHSRFSLLQETLYLTVALIDRFLQDYEVSRSQLQLVGITAMFIASKYEEMYAPEVKDFVYITDKAYSPKDIFRMECLILKTLQFSLGRPLPLHFLRRNSKAGDCDAVVHTAAKYLMELSLQEYHLSHVHPSLLAASALKLSMQIMDEAPWTDDLSFYSGYTEAEIQPIVTLLAKMVCKSSRSKLQAVRKKYAHPKFMKISTFSELSAEVLEKVAHLGA